jgi:ECF transporter S component (folate family)
MKKLTHSVRSAINELKSVQTITLVGMLIAVGIALSFFNLMISNVLQISFSFVPLAVGGMLFGPVIGGIMGVINDILGYLVRPNGPFFPGFTLNALISGIFYGVFLYKKPVTLIRIVIVSTLNTVLLNLLLTSLWLNMMYGQAYLVLLVGRMTVKLLTLPINIALLYFVLKLVERIRIRDRLKA